MAVYGKDGLLDRKKACATSRAFPGADGTEKIPKHREATPRHYDQHPERRTADSERINKFCAENPEWCKAQNEKPLASIVDKKSKSQGSNGTVSERIITAIPATINRFTAAPLTEARKRRVAGYARVSSRSRDVDILFAVFNAMQPWRNKTTSKS
jgi:hypothetical protein